MSHVSLLGVGEYLTKYEAVPITSTARSLTSGIYENAFGAEVTVGEGHGGAVRFRTDGTTVTATSGCVLNPGETLTLPNAAAISNFSVIGDKDTKTTVTVRYYRRVLDTLTTLANEATPTVLSDSLFVTGGTTTITDFDDGVVNQTIEILSAHAVTITDGSNILLEGSVDFVMAAGDSLTLTMFNDQVWEEVSRKTNLAGLEVVTTLDDTGTPSVLNGRLFKTGGTTAITDFDDGVVGQTIKILSAHTVTITDGSAVDLAGGSNYSATATDTLTLTMYNDQVWVEDARSVNGG